MGKGKKPKMYMLKEERFSLIGKEGEKNYSYSNELEDSLIDSMLNQLSKARQGKVSVEDATNRVTKGFDDMITRAKTTCPISMEKYKNAMQKGQEMVNDFLDNQLFNLFFLANFQIYIDYNFSKDSKEYAMLHRYIKQRMCYPSYDDEFQAKMMGHINVKSFYKSLLADIFNTDKNLEV